MTAFSAVGPTAVDGWFKPDLVAAGPLGGQPAGARLDDRCGQPVGPDRHRQLRRLGHVVQRAITSGAAALLRQLNPGWTPDRVKGALLAGAAAGPVGNPFVDGFGSLNVLNAATVKATLKQVAPTIATPVGATVSLFVTGAGSAWNGSSWNGSSWNGSSWNGSSWNGSSWNGSSWNGSAWNGSAWNGSSWNGSSWNGSAWNGSLVERVFVERLLVERLGVERLFVERLELERLLVERVGVERLQLERVGLELMARSAPRDACRCAAWLTIVVAFLSGVGTLGVAVAGLLRRAALAQRVDRDAMILTALVVGSWVWPLMIYRDSSTESEAVHLDEGFLVIMAIVLPPAGRRPRLRRRDGARAVRPPPAAGEVAVQLRTGPDRGRAVAARVPRDRGGGPGGVTACPRRRDAGRARVLRREHARARRHPGGDGRAASRCAARRSRDPAAPGRSQRRARPAQCAGDHAPTRGRSSSPSRRC